MIFSKKNSLDTASELRALKCRKNLYFRMFPIVDKNYLAAPEKNLITIEDLIREIQNKFFNKYLGPMFDCSGKL